MVKIIIDADVVARVLHSDSDCDFSHLHDAIFHRKRYDVLLAFGGARLTWEYKKAGMLRIISVLDKAGRISLSNDQDVDNEAKKIKSRCKSNDEHIVALARVGAVSIVATLDYDLSRDFRNRTLVLNGRTYKNKKHYKLLLP